MYEEKSLCSKYSAQTKQYCLMQNAHQISYPEIIEYCGQLGEWEEECRYDWMKKNKAKQKKRGVAISLSECL